MLFRGWRCVSGHGSRHTGSSSAIDFGDRAWNIRSDSGDMERFFFVGQSRRKVAGYPDGPIFRRVRQGGRKILSGFSIFGRKVSAGRILHIACRGASSRCGLPFPFTVPAALYGAACADGQANRDVCRNHPSVWQYRALPPTSFGLCRTSFSGRTGFFACPP